MEIHIGNRVADVSLVNKEGNKVQLTIDGKPYDVDIVMAEMVVALFCTRVIPTMQNSFKKKARKATM